MSPIATFLDEMDSTIAYQNTAFAKASIKEPGGPTEAYGDIILTFRLADQTRGARNRTAAASPDVD